jgi:transposase-like protein
LNISFNPTCFVQDACQASFNGIESVFEACEIIMCWFHVLQNVKSKRLIPDHEYNNVMQELQNMHYCKYEDEFNNYKEKIVKRWESLKELEAFRLYFRTQWLDSEFNNWQIYVSPPGFASTNNALESFNGRIKKFFTKRDLLTIESAIDFICKEVVIYHSVHVPEFKWVRIPNSKVKKSC